DGWTFKERLCGMTPRIHKIRQSSTLKEEYQLKSFDAYSQVQTIQDLRDGTIANSPLVKAVYYPVTIEILIFNITRPYITRLGRGIGDFFFAYQQTYGNIAEPLDDAMAYSIQRGILPRRYAIIYVLVCVTVGGAPEGCKVQQCTWREIFGVVQADVDT